MLQRIGSETEREALYAPEGARFIVRNIEHVDGVAEGRFIYLDENLEHLNDVMRADYAQNYDPRARSWYKQAQQTLETVTTEPYVFYSVRKVGVSIARRAGNGVAVIGADIPLDALGAVLARQKMTPSSQLALVRGDGMVVGHENIPASSPTATIHSTPPPSSTSTPSTSLPCADWPDSSRRRRRRGACRASSRCRKQTGNLRCSRST